MLLRQCFVRALPMPLPPPAPAGRQILDADNSGGLDGNEFCLFAPPEEDD